MPGAASRACRPQEGRGARPASVGDCVDCNACVAVCPMGIDIRDGNQLECINCALCIDACDAVMDKVGKPRGPDLLYHRQPLCAEHGGQERRLELASPAAAAHLHLFRPCGRRVGIAMLVTLLSTATGSTSTSCLTAIRSIVTLSDGVDPQRLHGQDPEHEAGAAHLPHHARRTCRAPPWKWSARTAQGAELHRCRRRARQAAGREDLRGDVRQGRAGRPAVRFQLRGRGTERRAMFRRSGSYEAIFHAPGERDEED